MSDRFVIAGLIVLVTNAQGKLRQVPLTLKQSGRVRRFVSKLHEGGLHIAPEDLLLLTEKDAMETFGKLTGKLPFMERWKRRFVRLGVSTGILPAVAAAPCAPDSGPQLAILSPADDHEKEAV